MATARHVGPRAPSHSHRRRTFSHTKAHQSATIDEAQDGLSAAASHERGRSSPALGSRGHRRSRRNCLRSAAIPPLSKAGIPGAIAWESMARLATYRFQLSIHLSRMPRRCSTKNSTMPPRTPISTACTTVMLLFLLMRIQGSGIARSSDITVLFDNRHARQRRSISSFFNLLAD